MVGWHHQLNGHEFEPALGVGDGQGSLACCNPWGCKESDTTERLNRTDIYIYIYMCSPSGSPVNISTCQRSILIPAVGRSPGKVNGNPLPYSCLENPMDRGAWQTSQRGHKESVTTQEQNSSNKYIHIYILYVYIFFFVLLYYWLL